MALSAEKTLKNRSTEAEVVALNLKPDVGYLRLNLLRFLFRNFSLVLMIRDLRYLVKLLRYILICGSSADPQSLGELG